MCFGQTKAAITCGCKSDGKSGYGTPEHLPGPLGFAQPRLQLHNPYIAHIFHISQILPNTHLSYHAFGSGIQRYQYLCGNSSP